MNHPDRRDPLLSLCAAMVSLVLTGPAPAAEAFGGGSKEEPVSFFGGSMDLVCSTLRAPGVLAPSGRGPTLFCPHGIRSAKIRSTAPPGGIPDSPLRSISIT